MKSLFLVCASVGIFASSLTNAFATPIIDFNSSSPTGNIPSYVESSFTFQRTGSGGNMGINGPSGVFSTNFLVFQDPATVTLTGPAAFNLNALDFASVINTNLKIVGNQNGGGTLNGSFSASGGLDLLGFGWTNLASVVFSTTSVGGAIGLDNIDVSLFAPPAAVPEPATLSIFGIGTMIGAVCQYRRRKRTTA